LVDGRWMVDDSGVKTDNPMGSQNNVISIDEQDFAVFFNLFEISFKNFLKGF